jgi:Tol biopolymer transport system component/DNA-binding winged helix-turn-helix (wHTH) protein
VSNSGAMTYTFGNCLLDRQRGCLLRDGQEIKLRPKSFELLAYLVENPGRLVTKDELMKAVWSEAFVTDDSLVQCVRDVRRALGDDSQHQVKTVPRRGYILGMDVIRNGSVNLQSSETRNGEESIPPLAPAASGPRNDLEVSARRVWPWIGTALVTLALISVVLALYPSATTTPPVWRAIPLTTYPGIEFNPAVSPDNRSVAFTWNGEGQDNFDIYVQPIGQGRPQRLTVDRAQDTSPAWSPKGDKIAFLRRIDNDRNQVVLIPAFGGPEQILAETLSGVTGGAIASDLRMNLTWTPDGNWVVAHDRETRQSPESLFLFSVSTGEKRLLIQTPAGYHDENTAFSPAGDAVAFSRHSAKALSELYLLGLSRDFRPSGSAIRLTNEGGQVTHPVWAKGGSRIFYRLGSNLRAVDVRSSGQPQVVMLEERGGIAELSLGRDLIYSQTAYDANIWRAEIPPRGSPPAVPHSLISSTRADNSAQYSRDGRTIAFRSSRSGSDEIWISNGDGSNPIQVTSFGPRVMFPNWSPDGLRLVFHARPEGQADIFTVAAGGGSPVRVTSDPAEDTLASYSLDGRWIYFSSNRSGESEIWKMPADGGDAIRLTAGGGLMPVESPDGKSVFYARVSERENGIWKFPVEGGKPERVTGRIAKDVAFAVGNEGIYYVTPPESPTRQLIHFLEFSTNQSRPVVVADREIGLGMSLSKDGRFLIFPQRDQAGSDLMIIRDFNVQK